MVLVRMRKYDATKIRNKHTRTPQTSSQGLGSFPGFRPSINESERIFDDQIDVDRADVEGSWKRYRKDAQTISDCRFSIADWKNCGLEHYQLSPNSKSEIRNPRFAILVHILIRLNHLGGDQLTRGDRIHRCQLCEAPQGSQ